eukprot:12895047-Prorocentrum_lima.AAC.1
MLVDAVSGEGRVAGGFVLFSFGLKSSSRRSGSCSITVMRSFSSFRNCSGVSSKSSNTVPLATSVTL